MVGIKALVFGYFGANNFGDEWTLAAFLRGCRKRGLPITPIVLSRCPQKTVSEHVCLAIPRRWDLLLRALHECYLVIGCGGSLLQDATSWRSLVFYTLLIKQAQMMGKKVALLGQGLGPLHRSVSRILARWALRSCDLVTFRDAEAARLAERLGATPQYKAQTADLTFTWDVGQLRRRSLSDSLYSIGLNVRPLPAATQRGAKAWGQGWRQALMVWLKRRSTKILLLPLQKGVDEAALTFFAEGLTADWWRGERWQDAFLGIAQVALLTAMRLHGLIAACLLGVPFVGIGYDPKVVGVLGTAFKAHLLPLSAPVESVLASLQQIVETTDQFLDKAATFVTEQSHRAWQNFSWLQHLL